MIGVVGGCLEGGKRLRDADDAENPNGKEDFTTSHVACVYVDVGRRTTTTIPQLSCQDNSEPNKIM